jgi:hypothetical protein
MDIAQAKAIPVSSENSPTDCSAASLNRPRQPFTQSELTLSE